MRKLAPVALAALAIAGCGGGDDGTTVATPTQPAITSSTTTVTPTTTSPPQGTTPSQAEPAIPTGTPEGKVPNGAGANADAKAVARTVRAYVLAIAGGNGFQACAQLSPKGRRSVESSVTGVAPELAGAPCQSIVVLYQNSYRPALTNSRVKKVRIRGNRATAAGPTYANGPARDVAVLAKRRGVWLIAKYGQ